MKKIFFVLLVLVGCKSDPYPGTGEKQVQDFEPVKPVRTSISADIPLRLDLNEGEAFSYQFRAVVPAPGKPQISIEDLPVGATFDPETFVLKWTPSYLDGNGIDDPTIRVRSYPLVIWITDSNNPIERLKASVTMQVTDVPREIGIAGRSQNDLNAIFEGTKVEYDITLTDKEYPNGPFNVLTSDFPATAQVSKISNTKYRVSFTTDFTHVSSKDTGCTHNTRTKCKLYKASVIVTNPAGHQSEGKVDLKIVDNRQSPYVVIAPQIEQGLDVGFQFAIYDPNREVAPEASFVGTKPVYGNFEVTSTPDLTNFSTNVSVKWRDLPPTYNGKLIPLRFKSCVLSATGTSYTGCREDETTLKIVVKDRKAPTIERSSFPIGRLDYLNVKEERAYSVKVRDGELTNVIPRVQILPESMAKFVQWSNDRLVVKFEQAGTFQFTLLASSEYNMQSSESFVVEVFPENRSKTLFLADSTKDDEFKFFQKNIPALDVMNPIIQDMDIRSISGRDTLIIGTSILRDAVAQERIAKTIAQIKNILIASPLVENLPQSFIDEIIDKYKVAIVGRYNEISNTPALDKMEFVHSADFQAPAKSLKLRAAASDESSNPLIFSTGVDTQYCRDVLEIADAMKLNRYKMGVICDRPTGGRLALFGTEFADLLTSEADKDIPKKWMQTMLQTKVLGEMMTGELK